MARPTVSWMYCDVFTGDASNDFKNIGNTLNFGSVQAGYWSAVKCVRAHFSSYASDLHFWLSDTMASNGSNNNSVDIKSDGNASGWAHTYFISNTYLNPNDDTVFTSDVKAGNANISASNLNQTVKKFSLTPENEPDAVNSSDRKNNWINSYVGDPDQGTGGYTDYIYLACRPAQAASDGRTSDWGFRISFLYS